MIATGLSDVIVDAFSLLKLVMARMMMYLVEMYFIKASVWVNLILFRNCCGKKLP